MPIRRFPESVQTLYAELLDLVRAADAETALAGRSGSFVSKVIRGRTYWYLQKSEGARKRQIYIGADSPDLRDRMHETEEARSGAKEDQARRRELVTMMIAGGTFRESAAVGTVLRILAEASIFRAGGVLVGTQAFSCIANLLGVSLEHESLRTMDIDVSIPLGITEGEPSTDILRHLQAVEPHFFAVPALHSREPSTSFKVRGRELRVDFLTPGKRGQTRPVLLSHLKIAAQPVVGLDYLIEEPVDAVAIAGAGIHVNVPSPARLALHKLWLSSQRPPSEQTKARKDLRQAEQLLEVLVHDRPQDLVAAYEAMRPRRSMFQRTKSTLRSLTADVRDDVGLLLQDAALSTAVTRVRMP